MIADDEYNEYKEKRIAMNDACTQIMTMRRGVVREEGRGFVSIVEVGDRQALFCDNFGFPMRKKEMTALLELLQRGLEAYTEEKEHEDILEEISWMHKEVTKANAHRHKKEEAKTYQGYVYLVKGENGRYKIGASKNPKKRVDTLRVSSSEDHHLVFAYEVEEMYKAEKAVHEAMSQKRKHSEWFELDDNDIEMIETYLKGMCTGGIIS